MKIGILAYHSACNFGANLQVLSTIGYLQRTGYTPIVLNYETDDFVTFYRRNTRPEVYSAYATFREQYMSLSSHCHTPQELAEIIEKEHIEAVIIGSDAVAQHHPLLERIIFPTRHIVSIQHMTQDRYFPNPFWGTFLDYMKYPIPIALLSASSQDSNYHLFHLLLRKQMWERLKQFQYISVRDKWTQEMYMVVSEGKLYAPITPDPVFAFNYNCEKIIPKKEEILAKYHLPEKYILLSFLNSNAVSVEWTKQFQTLAEMQHIACVALPFPQGIKFKHSLKHEIPSPLLPLDWYALIKYSQGYVGNNMHPIVVSLHNANPFFSFDNYGIKKYNGFYTDDYSSKIKHILHLADLDSYRISCLSRAFTSPTPAFVLDKLVHFPIDKTKYFAQNYYRQYENMMQQILNSFQINEKKS